MSETACVKPKILVAHQWKAERGLYGADRVMLRILRELAPIAELIVVIESEGEFADAAREIGCRVEPRDMGVLRRRQMSPLGLPGLGCAIVTGALWLARLIRKERVKCVFTSTVSVVSAALAAKLTGRPHVWLVQEILGGYSRALAIPVMQLSDKIIVVSQASARSIQKKAVTSQKIIVAYPGVDVRRFDSTHGRGVRQAISPEDQIVIGHVARIHYWKGQDYFLDALHELKKRGIAGFRAVIVGEVYPGYEYLRETLREKVKVLGLESEVRFLGHRDDVEAIFNAVDIVVSPSTLPDPCPLVVAEGMAARRPVIATAAGGSMEMIEDGVSGFLIPINEVSAFADRLERLVKDPNLRHQIGEAARKRIESGFSAEGFNRRVRQLVESMLS